MTPFWFYFVSLSSLSPVPSLRCKPFFFSLPPRVSLSLFREPLQRMGYWLRVIPCFSKTDPLITCSHIFSLARASKRETQIQKRIAEKESHVDWYRNFQSSDEYFGNWSYRTTILNWFDYFHSCIMLTFKISHS